MFVLMSCSYPQLTFTTYFLKKRLETKKSPGLSLQLSSDGSVGIKSITSKQGCYQDGSTVGCACCSCRGPRLGFRYSHASSQPSGTSVLRALNRPLLTSTATRHAHGIHTYVQRGKNPHTNKIKQTNLEISFKRNEQVRNFQTCRQRSGKRLLGSPDRARVPVSRVSIC